MAALLEGSHDEQDPDRKDRRGKRRSFSGDPEEYRLTLVEHLEELRDRIIRSIMILTVAWVIGWIVVLPVFDFLESMARRAIEPVLPKGLTVVWSIGITEAFFLKLKFSFAIGLALSFPFLALQLWGFIEPALTPKERQPLRRIAPVSLLLFAMGAGFCWLVMPSALRWFATYIEEFPGTTPINPAGTLSFFILKMMMAFGVAFQLPLVVYILGALELLQAETLIKYWRHSATAIFVVAMVITPSQDPLTMLMMAVPLVLLFIISVYAVKFTQGRKRRRQEAAQAID